MNVLEGQKQGDLASQNITAVWLSHSQVLCMLLQLSCSPAVSRGHCFPSLPLFSTVPGCYTDCTFPSQVIPEPRKQDINIDVPFRNENSTVSCSLHLDPLCVSVLSTIYFK